MRERENMGSRGRATKDGGQGYANDSSSFFFTNIPQGVGEKDMVKVFQKWASVKDVFISRRLNKWGRKFGFVSFFGVKDEGRLERELD